MKQRGGLLSKAVFGVFAINPEFGNLIWELSRNRGYFEEMSGQFIIYQEKSRIIFLELMPDDELLDTIEDDLDS